MINIKYIKTAFSADCSKNFDGKNMGKIGPKFDQFMWHILPMVFLRSQRSDLFADFNSHSHTRSDPMRCYAVWSWVFQFTLPYREWQEYSHKIKISATQLVFVFLPYVAILAHKRAFFNEFLIKSTTKINPVNRIVKDVTIVTSTEGHYEMIRNHRRTFKNKGD